jgi:hypothetical protein
MPAYCAWAFEKRDGGVSVLTEETQNGWLARLGALVMPADVEVAPEVVGGGWEGGGECCV